jgi:predicted enzyme related to lactoylglutathione lyase
MTRYTHGTIAWTELLAGDVPAQRAFYAELFGWRYDERGRARAAATGNPVAAIRGHDDRGWIPYIAVDDVAAVIARTGGSSHDGELVDSLGARFAVWDGIARDEPHGLNEVGGLAWNEVWTPDPTATIEFYRRALGWNLKHAGSYVMFAARDRPSWTHAGICELDTGPARWASYFEVADCAQSVELARSLGATIAIPATHVPNVGWIALAIDREGVRVGLMQSAG